MKKAGIAVAILLLCFSFVLPAAAEESFTIKPGKEFAVYGEDGEVPERLGMTEEEIKGYLKDNDIVYLAVDEKNERQIRLSVSETGFSKSVGHLSGLSDEKIRALMPELIGAEQGEILKKGEQKFIRQQLRLSDSGGEYLLTRYITVEAQKYYVLTFYTQAGVKTDYIETVFSSFSLSGSSEQGPEKTSPWMQILPPVLIALFSAGAGVILFLLIRDIRKPPADGENEAETE